MNDHGFLGGQIAPRQPKRAGSPAPVVASLLFVLLLPFLYVLSIGPVVAISEKTGRGHHAVEVVYAPVIWLHEHTFLKEPLERYAEVWGWK